jgi:hypothetical protein
VQGVVSLLVLMVWCSFCTWVTLPFFRLGKFSIIILLNRLSMPSVCNSSLSYTLKIHTFGLFMEFQISRMFHSYFLSIFSWSFASWSNFILCLLFLILYFQIAPLCSVSLWLWYLFGILSAYFGAFQGFHIFIDFIFHILDCLFNFIHLFVFPLSSLNCLFTFSLRSNTNFCVSSLRSFSVFWNSLFDSSSST